MVVSIKPTSATGAAGVTRYIAESKRNPEKEGLGANEPRPLFSYSEDKLTYHEANRILQIPTDTQAQKEDVIHMVISPEKGQYEDLGETREERYDAFKEIIREAVRVIEKEVNFVELYWIAGIHLNTDIPHAHLAICRDGLNSLTRRRGRIDHVPRTLLQHREKAESGEKELLQGKIADAVSSGIERQRELVAQRVQKLASQDHAESSRENPAHEEATRPLTPHADDDHQLTIASDPSTTGLVHEPADQRPIHPHDQSNETHLNSESQTIDIIPTTVPLVAPPIPNADRNHEQHSIEHDNQQDPTTTLVSHSKNQQHSTENTQAPDELQKPTHVSESLWRERFILGRSMVARAEVDRLQSDLNSTRAHGDKRRFRVFDDTHGYTRQISEFDIRRRADAYAAVAVREAQDLNTDDRQQLRQTRYNCELERHAKGIGDHQIIVSKTIHKLEGQLTAAQKEHAKYRPHVQQIQLRYQAQKAPLPVPLLRHSELNKLQDQAVANRNPARVRTLESIRESLASERSENTRTDKEVARLDGQLLVVRSEQAARQERAHQFERTRHQTRWQIDDKKYSLVELDRRITDQENRSRIFGSPLKITTLHLSPSARREAAAQVRELKTIRQLVVEKIENRRQELTTAVSDAGRMTAVLSEIHLKEHDRLIQRNGERHEKIVSRAETSQLIEHANLLSDPAMLKHAFMLEARYEERLAEDKRPQLTTTAARAIGREALSEIALQQATQKLNSFQEHKQFTSVAIKDLNGQEQTARLFDFRRPRHPLIWLAHRITERITESKEHAHLRTETTKAVDAEHGRLKEEVTRSTHCHELAKDMADFHREQLRSFHQPNPEPAFTPKQVIQLELYAARHPDPVERLRVETLVHRADLAAYSHSKQTHSKQTPLVPEPPLTNVTPGEPLRGAERQRTTDHAASPNHQPNKNDAFHLPPNHPSSHAQSPKPDRQPTGPQPSIAETAKEASHIEDLLH